MRRILFFVALSVFVSLAATAVAFLVTHPDRLNCITERAEEATE